MTEIDEHIVRTRHIMIGRAIPTADELLRLYPFLGDNLLLDIVTFAKYEAAHGPEQARPAAQSLLDAVGNADISDAELAGHVGILMDALPEDDRSGRLRCRLYRAVLGDPASRLAVACDAVSALVAAAGTDQQPTLADITLAWAALGWLATVAADDAFVPLSGRPRPGSVGDLDDTARYHGRSLLLWLLGDAWPGVPPLRPSDPG
ncbi:hypothetical protein [Microvirga tunisiensis]|uniref:Uncharacterized protein n=1 Tax=Microvirga tunisiensis TaxID=2108360 RepID=A0A5N7MPZ8_9HYPH|nr:hypothetical protein [Microvirga tunisiensis]MPR06201.1 hypothetical protein [Microvirga tunisiensis]MPR26056.1 hypothetical protein [Microvirga tunisiensis]